jgi:inner membrane protein
MASIGHVAIGMAAARIYSRGPRRLGALLVSMVLWTELSLLPDADVLGFAFGIRYGDPWGHRGATHSFVFSVALGTALGLLVVALRTPAYQKPALRTGVIASLVLVSHALLDTLTDGGLGCALFWPFDNERHFAPWQPIPVAPIGRDFLSEQGLRVALAELFGFAPVFLYALWPRTNSSRHQ